MSRIKPPEPMNFSQPNAWPEWKTRFERYRIASKLSKDEAEIQVSTLIYSMGPESEHLVKQFNLSHEEEKNYDFVLHKFDSHFTPQVNIIHERAMLSLRGQQPGEPVEAYIRAIYEMAERCNYGDSKEDFVRDRLVVGILDKAVSRELQMKPKLTLKEAIEYIRQSEIVKGQILAQADTKTLEETKAKTAYTTHRVNKRGSQRGGKPQYTNNARYNSNHKSSGNSELCNRCGLKHGDRCPAFKSVCNKCRKIGHYARCCKTKDVKEVNDTQGNNDKSDEFFLGTVTTVNDVQNCWFVYLWINNSKVKFKIDSGADVTVMSANTYKEIRNPPTLTATSNTLRSASGILDCQGKFVTTTKYKGKMYRFDVYVVETGSNLLSRSVAESMGVVKLNIPEIQSTMGKIKGDPVKIHLKDNAVPFHVNTARRIPVPLIPKVNKELDRMEREGVIQKITNPTEWCSAIVVVPKQGTDAVRICVDLRQLNKSVKRERYILPTLEDITAKMEGQTVFTKLDAASGYYQLELDPNSAELTTFITPKGRYFFKRLPFGLTSASEIFQRKMTEILEGLSGVVVFQDDILIAGRTQKEHDDRLNKVLNILDQVGFKLNKQKCEWSRDHLKFLGHIFSQQGVSPDPNKVRAIIDMPIPTNVKELQRVRGMTNYLGSYISNLATLMKPLNDLLKQDSVWSWGPVQDRAFNSVKEALTSVPTLAYYDFTKPTVVSADASSYGVGAVLMQKSNGVFRPVAFASRTLLPAETRYAQIEKECLASVWACEKFDRYLCGLDSFRLETDHKPLVPLINGTDLNTVPLRCQRLLMRLMRYNPVAEHVAGKQLIVADTLSRHPIQSHDTIEIHLINETETYIQQITDGWPVSYDRLQEIKDAAKCDGVMQTAIEYTIQGWPDHTQGMDGDLKNLHSVRAHLSVTDQLLIYDDRIVIPSTLKEKTLEVIHHGHQGITKCKERASTGVWWYGIGRDIAETVRNCQHCQVQRPAQIREALKTLDLPEGPWERVGTDLLMFEGNSYLVTIDYYSRFVELTYLAGTTSIAVIAKLKSLFARWGIPKELISDNEPQFSSEHFRSFANEYGFRHTTSSPRYPQSNGMAERAVQTAKRILKQKDSFLALLSYRSTPIESTGYSPAELLMNTKIRTVLPNLAKTMEQRIYDSKQIQENDANAKRKYEYFYNRRHSARPLHNLSPGDVVRVKTDHDKRWSKPATVISQSHTPRAYNIRMGTGETLRRNRKHVMKIPGDQPILERNVIIQNSIPEQNFDEQQPVSETVSPEIPQVKPIPIQTKSGRIVKPRDRLDI